ncbi:uncharacterized protein FTJAE_1827 [Fusarium tjaetaba]|uniref:Xylanolytic transcriptional activator regulatory domain-containing protein n=1 Tax=Fusarium tjaetaba TaxID=1567544 RepID=A0A8H5W4V0_9HYPO|nr:uncharacterized protein FTJAE_1827 [Fusarium tjaetaba]KAF5646996.1 hypothetical protein FTJAE_1827 [Fusarium tjaetaba]
MQLSYALLLVAAASSVLARRLVITPVKLFSGNDVYIYSNDGTEHAIKDFVPIDGCKYNRGAIGECCQDWDWKGHEVHLRRGRVLLVDSTLRTMAMLSTVVLLGCAVANVAIRCFIRAPDFLGNVTGMTRDSPYIQVDSPGGSGLGWDTVRHYVDAKLESHKEIEAESDGHQLRPLQVEEDKVQQTCIDEVCSVDMEKRRQKPFYFVSEEEYRLLRELCSKCFPDEELTIPNLRRLIDENQKPTFKTQTDIATPTMSLIEVSADAPLIGCGDEPIDQGQASLDAVEETQAQEEEILLPEIVNLHQDLGCLLADSHGEYRYMGAESGFPSQDLLSACAACFFEQVHCLYWIYSAESFYTRLETTYSGDTGQLTASWLCSLHGIVALCASCEPSPNGLVNGQRAHDSLEMAKSLVTRVCDEADLDSIRALIVLSLAFQSNGFTNSAYLHIGLAVRIAFSLGLHLDKYSTKSGVVSQAHARRLWWTLYLVDQDLSLALGKPSMNSPPNETSWNPPLPSEFVVSPGSHTPNGYLEQCIRLAQITQSIRQNLYDGPLHGGQKLSRAHFNDSISALQDWLDHVSPHLHLSPSVSLSYRRSISLLHLRYWSTMMLVTKPFLLCNLLQGIEHVEAVKQPMFATLAKTCVSAAESSFEILESMVLYKVASSLVMADYLFALQALQVIVAACGLYHMDGHQARAKQCLRILLAISVSGYPKHLIPETLFQLQQCGLAEGVEETLSIPLQASEPLGYPQMVTEPLQRISLDQSTDQLAMTWLNELDMADIVIDNGFLDNLMDISSIFPFGSS